MNLEAIEERKNEITKKYGAWTAHNIHLQGDSYTISPAIVGDEVKLRRVVQCISDLHGGSVAGLRVLDLACLEGLYAIEFGRRQAKVVGVEGREANVEKARFAKEALGLTNVEFVQDDVRNLSRHKYGEFDVVLCLGILYHLDVPDVFAFISRLGEVCRRVCLIDTRICVKPTMTHVHNGKRRYGARTEEHDRRDSAEQKISKLWASIDNNEAFWLTRPSLYNALYDAGFTSVYECNIPAEPNKPADRITFVAIKGKPVDLLSAPLISNYVVGEMPERPQKEETVVLEILKRFSRVALPKEARKRLKRLIGRENPLS